MEEYKRGLEQATIALSRKRVNVRTALGTNPMTGAKTFTIEEDGKPLVTVSNARIRHRPGTAVDKRGREVPTIVPFRCGRNDPCPCGSGNKYKRCHGKRY